MTLHPTVLWAQRDNIIFLTVQITDITEPKIDVTPQRFYFKGRGEAGQNEYEADIELYDDVDADKTEQHLTPRSLSMILHKKKPGYWPHLQKGAKLNFVKVDFSKWKDEDDDEPEGVQDPMGGIDFQKLMSQAGGNLPGMGDMPDLSSFTKSDNDDKEANEEEDEKAEETAKK